MNKNNLLTNIKINSNLFWSLTVIFLLTIIGGLYFSFTTENLLKITVAEYKEEQRPANLEITLIKDSSCQECNNLDGVLHSIKQESIKITQEKILEYTEEEAKNLLTKYSIKTLPALLITGEINKSADLTKIWSSLGQSDDNTFILRYNFYPVKDLETNKIQGLTDIFLLSDLSCQECYDVKQHLAILSGFGLSLNQVTNTDTSSKLGQELIKKYQIKKVPTIVLTGNLNVFDSLKKTWGQVGTIETDGAYVFRDGLDKMKIIYKDLTSNKIITFASSTNK